MPRLREQNDKVRDGRASGILQEQQEMITTNIKYKDRKISIQNMATVMLQMEAEGIETFECEIRRPFENCSDEQVAYVYAEVCIKAMMGYRAMGQACGSKEMAYEKLCLEEEIDFTNRVTDMSGTEWRVPKKIRKEPKHSVFQFINKSVVFVETYFNLEVVTPEEWKKYKEIGTKIKGKAKRQPEWTEG